MCVFAWNLLSELIVTLDKSVIIKLISVKHLFFHSFFLCVFLYALWVYSFIVSSSLLFC